MDRNLAFVLLMLGLAAGGATALARTAPDATPSQLAGLGYPELVVTTDGTMYDAPEPIPTGPQVWSVENTGAHPHFVDGISVPDGTTVPGIMAALGMADPPAEGPADLSAAVGQGGLSILSVGLTGYVEMDLEPVPRYLRGGLLRFRPGGGHAPRRRGNDRGLHRRLV